MSRDARHALLFGATGLIGNQLLAQLLANSEFAQVIAVTRRPLPQSHVRLRNLVSDFSSVDVPLDIGKADVAFCCLGTTLKQAGGKAGFYAVDHDLVLRCAGWARQSGARHFVAVSAMGASASSPVYYNRVKAETETGLEALGFPQLTLVQPSLLLGERGGGLRLGETLAIKLTPLIKPLMAGPLSPYTPVDASDVAAAMLARALKPAGVAVERLRWRDIMSLAGRA
jgi:uncharacterized protein YbjT (DUF2867 family)